MTGFRVHHLNTGTMCPVGRRWLTGRDVGRLVCHCLLVETNDGLVLVDTGMGLDDCARPGERLGKEFCAIARPKLDPDETAARQIEKLGFSIADVRHILPTHMDPDHAGGLSDFPNAAVHLYVREHDAVQHPTLRERPRYRRAQTAHGPRYQTYSPDGEPWFGFECVRALEGLAGTDILIVPTVGHSRGHAAIAVRSETGWMLHAGDAYFHRDEMNEQDPSCPALLGMFQRIVAADNRARLTNQARLRRLVAEHASEVQVFSAHDEVEFTRCL